MKKQMIKIVSVTFIFSFLFFSGRVLLAQVTLDCESGDRNIDAGNCWAFGGLAYRSITQDPALIISGEYSARSPQLTNPSPTAAWIKTPWLKPGSGNITFKTRLSGGPGNSRGIIISYAGYDPESTNASKETPHVQFYSFEYPLPINGNTTVYDISVPMPDGIVISNEVYKIVVSFIGQGGSGRAYADDLFFPGTYWADPPVCLPLELIADADGDGVMDTEDDYPDDPYKAYDLYEPAADFGTIAFEDLWPSFGDSDFNDLILDYRLNFVTNASGQLVEMKNKFVVRAIGASQKNGFGFTLMGVPADAVLSTEGDVLIQGIISKNANGVESNQSQATFIIIDNAFAKLPATGGGYTGANTIPEAPYVTPDTIFFNVAFINQGTPAPGGAIVYSDMISNPKFYNPFIFINQIRGKEVHMADYPPTDLADPSFFGTYNDDSKPGEGKFYKSKNNIPWAMLLVEKFDYPVERADIIQSHLKFKEWAESSGAQYENWFKDLQGYRNSEKIFPKRGN